MSFIGSNPKFNTSTFTPQSADPSNPTEGMVFYADGTSRAEGLWQYTDATWVALAADNPYSAVDILTSNTTLDIDNQVILANAAGGSFTITLPAVSGNNGKIYTIKALSASSSTIITIDGNGAETVNGRTTIELTSTGSYVQIVCDETNSNWAVINQQHFDILTASATTTSTSVADTYVDVTGMAISLRTGIWQVGFNAGVSLVQTSGAAPQGNVVLTDSGNTPILGCNAYIGGDSASSLVYDVSRSAAAYVEITSGTSSHKVRIRCDQAAASGQIVLLGGGSYTGALTNPDGDSYIWAKKIGA